ncbi:uncharacterized protein M421DRAFT_303967 [Didymella exigua CBS 183.55]|uniref:Uncharacterized protein n=1 Tax=Didymella exigua CBS 183.55 TaxID=1150837 RepID=A0A6A5R838_9PLEO|nr:uncharacterized protein M421DRAFT_303967 [Didymella exigua CBS 183.55]KAF1923892.1 hypothetical protein M421DRAFT_303967 [Didymella exigua CBS 183.55]
MSLHARQPTLLRMVMNPSCDSAPSTPTKASTTPTSLDTSPNRTELEPTPLLLALDMVAERKRLRSRKDSILTGAEETHVEDQKEEVDQERKIEMMEEDLGDGKEVIIPVKEDLNQLAILGQIINSGFWNGVEGVRKGVWGLVGWT